MTLIGRGARFNRRRSGCAKFRRPCRTHLLALDRPRALARWATRGYACDIRFRAHPYGARWHIQQRGMLLLPSAMRFDSCFLTLFARTVGRESLATAATLTRVSST